MLAIKMILGIVAFFVILIFTLSKNQSQIHVERLVSAPVEKVWAVWTEAETIKSWWGPKDFTSPVIKNNFQVGGRYLLSI